MKISKSVIALILSFMLVFAPLLTSYKVHAFEPVTIGATAYFVYETLYAAGLIYALGVAYEESSYLANDLIFPAIEQLNEEQFALNYTLAREFEQYMDPAVLNRWQKRVEQSTIVIPYSSPLFPLLGGGNSSPEPPNNNNEKKMILPFIPDRDMIDQFVDFILGYPENGKNDKLKKGISEAITKYQPSFSDIEKKLMQYVSDIPISTDPPYNNFVYFHDVIGRTDSVKYFYNVSVQQVQAGRYKLIFNENTRFFYYITDTDSGNVQSGMIRYPEYRDYFVYEVGHEYSPEFTTKSLSFKKMDEAPIPGRIDQLGDNIRRKIDHFGNTHISGSPFTVNVPVPQRSIVPYPNDDPDAPDTYITDPFRIPIPKTPQEIPTPKAVPHFVPSTMPELIPSTPPGTVPSPDPGTQPGKDPWVYPFPNPNPGTQPSPGTNPFPYPNPVPSPTPLPSPNPDPGTQQNPNEQNDPFKDDIEIPKFDFSPLMNSLPRKFPFCIPFDLFDLVRSFSIQSNFEPVFQLEIYDQKVDLDLRFINPYIQIFRQFFFLFFLIGMIHVTRSLIKW